MKIARIYKPCKNAMQSPKNDTKKWLFEYQALNSTTDEIIGWIGSDDMLAKEVKIKFETKEQAIEYAVKNSIPHEVFDEANRIKPKVRPYSSNYQ